MKINILGEVYNIRSDNDKNPKLINANAYIEFYSKEIVYSDDLFKDSDCRKFNNIKEFGKKVLRHEAIHGILQESGCTDWAGNEALVDFLAYQYPKIKKICDEIETIAEEQTE